MQVENIRYYLAFAYSDEKLAALLAHAEEGRLIWASCCCFIGIPTAPHPLRTWFEYFHAPKIESIHLDMARALPFGKEAEKEFEHLGHNDWERRKELLPLIRAEMERRELAREQSIAAEPALVG